MWSEYDGPASNVRIERLGDFETKKREKEVKREAKEEGEGPKRGEK